MITSYITLLIAMIVVSNPVGNVGLFLQVVKGKSHKEAYKIVLKTMLISSFMMILILFAGSKILSFMGISLSALSIAGSIILLHIGFNMVMGNKSHMSSTTDQESTHTENTLPSFMPLSFPLLCGPGVIAVLIMHSSIPSIEVFVIKALICIAVTCMTGIVYCIAIKAEDYISRTLLTVVIRLGGLLVLCIGMQMLISTTKQFFM